MPRKKKATHRAYVYPLKSALPCTVCVDSEKRLDRKCAACMLRGSKFQIKTPQQLARIGLHVDEQGRVYKEIELEEDDWFSDFCSGT